MKSRIFLFVHTVCLPFTNTLFSLQFCVCFINGIQELLFSCVYVGPDGRKGNKFSSVLVQVVVWPLCVPLWSRSVTWTFLSFSLESGQETKKENNTETQWWSSAGRETFRKWNNVTWHSPQFPEEVLVFTFYCYLSKNWCLTDKPLN